MYFSPSLPCPSLHSPILFSPDMLWHFHSYTFPPPPPLSHIILSLPPAFFFLPLPKGLLLWHCGRERVRDVGIREEGGSNSGEGGGFCCRNKGRGRLWTHTNGGTGTPSPRTLVGGGEKVVAEHAQPGPIKREEVGMNPSASQPDCGIFTILAASTTTLLLWVG